MKKAVFKIVFVADIADDIDDLIGIEYLHNLGLLNCVVLDGKSVDSKRERDLINMGINVINEIPLNTDYIFCGGALTKVNEYLGNNKLKVLVANGGFAGTNIVHEDDELFKFKGKLTVRTYNFNLDVISAENVLNSDNVSEIILVPKNVCHNLINTFGALHKDTFIEKYNLSSKKRLHDLLMVKEGVNHLLGDDMLCEYKNVSLYYHVGVPLNMSKWGAFLNPNTNIKICVRYK